MPLAIALESATIETDSHSQEQSMLSPELKAQVLSLPPDDRLTLIAVIVESLKNRTITQSDRSSTIQRMRGLLKTDQPAPTDEEVAAMLEERRVTNAF
ncbi:hypothetical protein [Leptolyngbya sp. BL0902]|uniref:hypothetical protein n=1 Tax=Leptolyngbya sp. BL0902 TaxID=1115757 RepID=UPI0021F1FFA5|nr:hypothetical protein [Leptolyngbya sp. BL0902]